MRPPPPAVIRVAGRFSRWLHRVADAPLPLEVRVLQLITASVNTEVIYAMTQLEIADHLRTPMTVRALAARVGADELGLLRLLRVAEHLDLVRRRGDDYELTRFGETLRRDRPASMAPFSEYHGFESTRRAWAMMTEAARTGRPTFEAANGVRVWEWFETHPDEADVFATTMRTLTELTGADLARAYPWASGSTICDVGGGVGTMLCFILERDPSLSGILLDKACVLDESVEYRTERGMDARIRSHLGDFFEPIDVTADVFTLKDVLHDWDDEGCIRILRNVRAAMRADNRLVLFEIPQDPHQAHPLVPFVDLTMLCHTDGGRQRSVEDFDALFASAGFRRTRTFESPLHPAIEAVIG